MRTEQEHIPIGTDEPCVRAFLWRRTILPGRRPAPDLDPEADGRLGLFPHVSPICHLSSTPCRPSSVFRRPVPSSPSTSRSSTASSAAASVVPRSTKSGAARAATPRRRPASPSACSPLSLHKRRGAAKPRPGNIKRRGGQQEARSEATGIERTERPGSKYYGLSNPPPPMKPDFSLPPASAASVCRRPA